LTPFIIGIDDGCGLDTKVLLQRFLIGMRDHFGDAERGTSIYKVFLILSGEVAEGVFWLRFCQGEDAIKLLVEWYNVKSMISL